MRKFMRISVVILIAAVAVSLWFFRHTPFVYSGVLEAVEVDVPSRLNDIVSNMYFEEGQSVREGQTLAKLDCKDTVLARDIAKKEFARAETLLKTSAGSKENFDVKQNAYDQAALRESWCSIKSPISGKVLYKYYENGEFVNAGRKLYTVADLSKIDAWVYVGHDVLAKIKTGAKVQGSLPETGQKFEGTVFTVNDEAEFTPKNVQTRKERTRLVYGVKVRFANDAALTLKPGMDIDVNF